VASDERIEEERQRVRAKGCDCACEVVTDPVRIYNVGADPDDPDVIVFNHDWSCIIARTHYAPFN
jgi:hypothetical protein